MYRSASPSLCGSSPWPSQPPSDSPSPNSSFRIHNPDTTRLLARKQTAPCIRVCRHHVSRPRASSLDDVRVFRQVSQKCHQHHRRSASARSARSSRSGRSSRRRRSSACSTRTGSRRSTVLEVPPVLMKEEEEEEMDKDKRRRHRIAVWMVLAAFVFIALSSITVVVVTLTHTSQYNNTITYYTFAKPSNLASVTRSQGK